MLTAAFVTLRHLTLMLCVILATAAGARGTGGPWPVVQLLFADGLAAAC